MKKIISFGLAIFILLSMVISLPLCVSAASLSVTNNKLPTTMKVGQILPYESDYATVHNLLPNEEFMGGVVSFDGAIWNIGPSEAKGGASGTADTNGSANIFCEPCMAYRSGTINASVTMYLYTDTSFENVSSKFATIKIEKPTITHNAPSSVKVGSSINFTTAITNTAYSNSKVSSHKDNEPFYVPYIDIIEGKNIVTQDNQDYTNTLCTSETLTFNNSGSVTLKIKYQPTVYHVFDEAILIDETFEIWKQTKGVIDYEKLGGQAVLIYLDGSVEELVTINVTKDNQSNQPTNDSTPSTNPSETSPEKAPEPTDTTSNTPSQTEHELTTETTTNSSPEKDPEPTDTTSNAPSQTEHELTTETTTNSSPNDCNSILITDQDTGIMFEAPASTVPQGTVLQVKNVNENDYYTIVETALEGISDNWIAYDISLMLNGAEIQPTGKVKLTIPKPQELNINNISLYHIANDMTLTPISFTVDSNDNIVFEAEHFSLYSIAEVSVVNDIVNNSNITKDNHSSVWIIFTIFLVVVIIAGLSIWYIKVGKK